MLSQRNRRARRAAFTLMEVLVVAAILVILAGVGGVIMIRYLEEAKKDRVRIDLKSLETAVQTYQLSPKHPEFPPTLQVLTLPEADGSPPYLEVSALLDPWGREYQYTPEGQHNKMTAKPDIWSLGPKLGDPNGIIGNWPISQGAGGH